MFYDSINLELLIILIIVRAYRNSQQPQQKMSINSNAERICTEPVALDCSPLKEDNIDNKNLKYSNKKGII